MDSTLTKKYLTKTSIDDICDMLKIHCCSNKCTWKYSIDGFIIARKLYHKNSTEKDKSNYIIGLLESFYDKL